MRIRIGKVTLLGNRPQVTFIVSNNDSQPIEIKSVVGEVYLNGIKFGNVERFEPITIKPNAKTYVDVSIRLMALQIAKIIEQFMNEKVKIIFSFTGSINVNDRPTPIQVNYKIV